jgi:penicillin G amidase
MSRVRRPLILALPAIVLLAGCPQKNPFEDIETAVEVRIPGLDAPVEVLRDRYGVPHIYCETDLDCIRVQGYVQAHDRLFTMDVYRRYAQGTLGQLFITQAKELVRPIDRQQRLMFMAADGRSVIDHIAEGLDDDTRAMLEAYTEGVNAYISAYGTDAAPKHAQYEIDFIQFDSQVPAPWTIEDSIGIGRLFSYMLSQSLDREMRMSYYADRLDEQTFRDLVPLRPMDPTYVVPGFYEGQALSPPPAIPEAARERLARARPLLDSFRETLESNARLRLPFGPMPGSNNWVVHGSLTDTGEVFVAEDPHLELSAPPIFHEVHLDAVSLPGATGRIKARGVAFPGTPGIIIGHTDHVAWAVTVVGYDVTDVYVETVTGPNSVRFDGEDVAVERITVQYPVDAHEAYEEEKICLVPHHGPIFEAAGGDDLFEPSTPCFDPEASDTALSVRWTGMAPTYEVRTVRLLLQAEDLGEALAAIDHFGVGAQNWVLGDRNGDIAYYPRADVPIRDNPRDNPPWLPMSGEGDAEWIGIIPNAELPQAHNPERGFIVTANNDIAGVTDDDDPLSVGHYLYPSMDLGLRAGRITRLLEEAMEGGRKLTFEDMIRIQTDTKSDLGAWTVPYLLEAADARPDLVAALDLEDAITRLRAWQFDTPTGLATSDPDGPASLDPEERAEAIGASLFGAWWFAVIDRTMYHVLDSANATRGSDRVPMEQPIEKAMYFILSEGDKDHYFDDSRTETTETREDVLLQALADATESLRVRLGSDPDEWLWGRLHQVMFRSFFGQVGVPTEWDLGPVANPGGQHTVNVANYNRNYVQHSGAALRMITAIGADGLHGVQSIPGGNIDQRSHPNRDDQIEMWLAGEFKEIGFDVPGTRAGAEARTEAGLGDVRWVFKP